MRARLYGGNKIKNEKQLDFLLSNVPVLAELPQAKGGNNVGERLRVVTGVMELHPCQEM